MAGAVTYHQSLETSPFLLWIARMTHNSQYGAQSLVQCVERFLLTVARLLVLSPTTMDKSRLVSRRNLLTAAMDSISLAL